MKKNVVLALICITALTSSCKNETNHNGIELTTEKGAQNYEIAQKNKKIVVDFYQKLFGDKDISVVDSVIGDPYIQHNPMVADGKEAFKAALKVWFKDAPKIKVDFQHVVAEDDLVVLHVKQVDNGKITAVVDIFKLKNGKIIEHWDSIQSAPDKSANDHPMF